VNTEDPSYLREMAARAARLADGCADGKSAEVLRILADDYTRRAVAAEAPVPGPPGSVVGG
jgi:hypothetical protein